MKNKIGGAEIWIAIIILVLAAGAIAYGLLDKSSLETASIIDIGGFTIDSITTTQFISNEQNLASANFRVAISADGGGESLVGTIDPSEFEKWNLGNIKATYPLRIDLGTIKEKLQYSINNEGAVYRYSQRYINRTSYWTGAECGTKEDYEVYCYVWDNVNGLIGFGHDRVIKVYKTPAGSYGRLNLDAIAWQAQMTLSLGGRLLGTKEVTQTIGSAESSADFYDGSDWFATAKWTGNKNTGIQPPNVGGFKASYLYANNKWQVSDYKYYQDYSDSLQSTKNRLDGLVSTFDTKCSERYEYLYFCGDESSALTTAIATQNQGLYDFTKQNRQIDYTAATAVSGNENSGIITETVARKYTVPTAVITLKADKLGILISTGKPEIIPPIESKSFSSGDSNGLVVGTIKNAGTARGTFSATFTESSGTFYPIDNEIVARISLNQGETGKISIRVGHGAGTQATSKPATFKVVEVNSPSKNYDTKDFTISMTEPKKCVPNSQRADGETVWTCKADGSGEEIALDCTGKGLDYANGKYSCKTGEKETPTPTVTGNASKGAKTASVKWYETGRAQLLGLLVFALIIVAWKRFKS